MMMLRTSLTGGNGIGFDVLDPQSYLAGIVRPRQHGRAWRRSWQMLPRSGRHRAPVSALGPGSRLDLTAADTRGGHLKISPKRIAEALASHISIADRIDVENQYGATTVHYLIDGAPQPLTQAISDNSCR